MPIARDAARLRVRGDRTTPGVDIVGEKRAAREEERTVEAKTTLPTFEQCAERYIDGADTAHSRGGDFDIFGT
jgi:hypothetical protein